MIVWTPYCGVAPGPDELFGRWNLDPVLLVALVAGTAAWLHFTRATPPERRYLLAASGLLAFLFVSPFCALTSALFSVRTVHHLALTALAGPLFAFALPRGGSRRVAFWVVAHAVTFWSWHLPSAYEAALSDDAIYWVMQASLLLTAIGLWRGVRQASLPSAIIALLATTIQMGLLGALLTFTSVSLYAPHFLGPVAWGLSPLEDQQLAGLIMWAPGAGIYLAAAVMLAARRFASERAAITA